MGKTIFHDFAQKGNLGELRNFFAVYKGQLIDLLNEKDYEGGATCIHFAARFHTGFLAIKLIKVLVQLGADLNADERSAGETVLHLAVHHKDYELLEWLCTQPGIKLDAKNYGDQTAYQIAFKKKNEQLMEILRKAGADCEEPPMSDSEYSDSEYSDSECSDDEN